MLRVPPASADKAERAERLAAVLDLADSRALQARPRTQAQMSTDPRMRRAPMERRAREAQTPTGPQDRQAKQGKTLGDPAETPTCSTPDSRDFPSSWREDHECEHTPQTCSSRPLPLLDVTHTTLSVGMTARDSTAC